MARHVCEPHHAVVRKLERTRVERDAALEAWERAEVRVAELTAELAAQQERFDTVVENAWDVGAEGGH